MTSHAENLLAQVENANPEAMRGAAANWQASLNALTTLKTKLASAREKMVEAAEGDAADAALAAFDAMTVQVEDNITRMGMAKAALDLAANRLEDAQAELVAVRGMEAPPITPQPQMPPVDATPEESDSYQDDLAAHNESKANAAAIAKQREDKAAKALQTLDKGLEQAEAKLTKAAPSAKPRDDTTAPPTGPTTPRGPRTAPPSAGSYASISSAHHGQLHGIGPVYEGEPVPPVEETEFPRPPEEEPETEETETENTGEITKPGNLGTGVGGAIGAGAGLLGACARPARPRPRGSGWPRAAPASRSPRAARARRACTR